MGRREESLNFSSASSREGFVTMSVSFYNWLSVSSWCFPEGVAIGEHLVRNYMSTEDETELQEVDDCVLFLVLVKHI